MIDNIPIAGVNSPPGLYFVEIVQGSYNHKTKTISIEVKAIKAPAMAKLNILLKFYVPSTQWLFNKICLACGMDNRKQPIYIYPKEGHEGLVGKKMYMALRVLIKVYNNGEIINEMVEPFDFFKESDHAPAILGDPCKNNGIPSGPFIKELVYSFNDKDVEYNEMPMPESFE